MDLKGRYGNRKNFIRHMMAKRRPMPKGKATILWAILLKLDAMQEQIKTMQRASF